MLGEREEHAAATVEPILGILWNSLLKLLEGWEDGSVGKHLLHKREDLRLNPQCPCKSYAWL